MGDMPHIVIVSLSPNRSGTEDRENTMNLKSKRVRKAIAGAALTATAVGAFGSSAMAQQSNRWFLENDDVKITTQNVDFGDGNHFFGTPTGNARVTWRLDSNQTNLRIHAQLSGRVYWDDISSGCARVRVQYLNANNGVVATDTSGAACRTGFQPFTAPPSVNVSESATNANIRQVRIFTQRALTSNSPWQDVGNQTVKLG